MSVTARRPARPSPALVGWGLAGIAIALTVGDVWMAAEDGTSGPPQLVNLTLIVVAVVGAIVISRRPSDATGWILCGMALIGGLGGFLWDYGYRSLVFGVGPASAGWYAIWIGSWVWIAALGAGLPALFVRLPDGQITARWRGVDWLAVLGSLAVMLSIATSTGFLDNTGHNLDNPFAIPSLEGLMVVVRWLGYALLGVAFVASVASLLLRFRNATGDERQQIKWITSAGVVVSAALIYGLLRQAITHESLFVALTPLLVSTIALPIGIGIALLKYRLYEIDLVINRTLVYGGLTALLAGLYTFVVGLTQKLVFFSGQRSDLVILLTAFIGAATFTPVKSWLQRTVDRRFAVHDPASVVDSMREQIEVIVNVLDAHRIARRLVEDSAATYQARGVSLVLGSNGETAPFHTWGDGSTARVLEVPLHSQGRELGVLWLGARRGGAAYTARDQRALQQCADAVAEAISLWEGALRRQLQPADR